jgi:hypothetical protein
MNFFKKLLSENNEVSCMRLMAIISLFVGSSIAYIALYKNCDLTSSAPTISIFVGAAFGGKIWQKYAEVKKDAPNDPKV